MKKALNVPASVAKFRINSDAFMAIAAEAVDDPCTGTNPRSIDVEMMKAMYICAYEGQDVNYYLL